MKSVNEKQMPDRLVLLPQVECPHLKQRCMRDLFSQNLALKRRKACMIRLMKQLRNKYSLRLVQKSKTLYRVKEHSILIQVTLIKIYVKKLKQIVLASSLQAIYLLTQNQQVIKIRFYFQHFKIKDDLLIQIMISQMQTITMIIGLKNKQETRNTNTDSIQNFTKLIQTLMIQPILLGSNQQRFSIQSPINSIRQVLISDLKVKLLMGNSTQQSIQVIMEVKSLNLMKFLQLTLRDRACLF